MIYTVECSYADPRSEAEWNEFYSLQKLPALIAVPGFRSSQRFRALGPGGPRYLALHTIDALAVLESAAYRHQGGGNFARWQAHITDWHRNLYQGLDQAPDVSADQGLVLSATGPQPRIGLSLSSCRLQAVALDRWPEQRWLARLTRDQAPDPASLPEGVQLYEPMTACLRPGAGGAGECPR